ncbi:MAG: glycerol kinase GlpK, partial [Planctomycetota bacterium]|nr:glycerol kinase GlpK [Planctomycetota bacterium]
MSFVLALDQGTTSSRAIVFDREGRAIASAQEEFPQHFPQPGWVEHDPEAIWQSQRRVAEAALAHAGLTAGDVAAIGLTNQRETLVVWDAATREPIHSAIVWQDRRTADRCQAMRETGHEEAIRARTGLVLDPYFSATKLAWILDHVPGARARAETGKLKAGTIDTWLIDRLTDGAVHATDASNASRTLLYDLASGTWHDELLEAFGIPRALLPAIVPSSGVLGEVRIPGPLQGIPIAGVAGDQQAALFGQAAFEPGVGKCTYGTGCFILLNTGPEIVHSKARLLSTVACARADTRTFALEGSVFVGGAVVQWLRDGLGLIEHSGDIEALAASVPDTGGVVFVPAFAGLGAPHWDPDARGLLVGLTRGTTAGHVARAALESIALQVADVVDAMRTDGVAPSELRVDGGAAVNDAL